MVDKKKILARLQNLCVRREYCESDMYAKALKAVEGDELLAAELLQSLVEDKFVSDLRYATAYAREKSSISGWGPVKIRYMLSHKGIAAETITEALGEVDEGSAQVRLEKLIAAKYRQLSEDPYCKIKLLKYALGRGYGYDLVKDIVKKVMES